MNFPARKNGEITRRLTVYLPRSLELFIEQRARELNSSKNAVALQILAAAKQSNSSAEDDVAESHRRCPEIVVV